MPDLNQKTIEAIIRIALRAGSEILDIYREDFAINFKEDNSPLTEADIRSHRQIVDGLFRMFPEIPILSEEGESYDYDDRKAWSEYWCIDPLDGTKEFISNNDEFTVNIALIRLGNPVFGVVFAPVLGELFFTNSYGKAIKRAYKKIEPENDAQDYSGTQLPIKKSDNHYRIITSKNHMSSETRSYIDQRKKEHPALQLESLGSSLKLCRVAEGVADEYPRFAPTMEWDTAAAHAVVNAAGKKVVIIDGNEITSSELVYNKQDLRNPWFLVT